MYCEKDVSVMVRTTKCVLLMQCLTMENLQQQQKDDNTVGCCKITDLSE